MAIILRRYYSMFLALIGAEYITSKDVDYSSLDGGGTVLFQRYTEVGQSGQYGQLVERSVGAGDCAEVTQASQKVGGGGLQSCLNSLMVEPADLVMVQSGEHATHH